MIVHGTDDNFSELIKEGKVLVDFFATWCGPCKMLAPVLEEVAKEYPDIKFVKMDVDECSNVSKEYGIMSVPTLLKLENGKLIDKKIGYVNKEELIKWIS